VTSAPPEGWYPDPVGAEGALRYWDGSAWTEQVHLPGVLRPLLDEPARRDLVRETRFVMVAFLVPGIAGAIVLLARHVSGVGSVTRFPVYVSGHPLTNMLVGIVAYLPTACMVPLALFLLNRTGDSPSALGLGVPRLRMDVLPAIGLVAASFGAELVVLVPLAPLGSGSSRRFRSDTS
jgi:hypothetical protein